MEERWQAEEQSVAVVVERIAAVAGAELCVVLGRVEDSSFAECPRAEAHTVVVLQELGLNELWSDFMYYLGWVVELGVLSVSVLAAIMVAGINARGKYC